jgi:hypothetical protein
LDAGVIGKGLYVTIKVTHFFISVTLASAGTKFTMKMETAHSSEMFECSFFYHVVEEPENHNA